MPSRLEGGSDASPLYFFLSYAHSRGIGPEDRFEHDALVHRFEQDLGNAVLDRAHHPRAIVPGLSDAHIPLGGHWPSHLANALARCRSFVALYCGEYFDSPECGREWSAFAARVGRDFVRDNTDHEAFIPVLWLPIRPDAIPETVRNLQYLHPGLGQEYQVRGLRYLMLHRELRGQYQRAVDFFADRVIAVAESDAPAVLHPPPVYHELASAFDARRAPTNRPRVRIVVAAPRLGRLPKGCDPEIYGEEAEHWRPYLPAYAGEIAQTARRLAESMGFHAFIESAEHCRELIPKTEPTAPTVLIVDPWAAQQPDLQQRLNRFDRSVQLKTWVRLVVAWNRANELTAAAEVDLESRLDSTLGNTRARCRRETPRAADGLESVEDLINELPLVFRMAERHYLALAKNHAPPNSNERMRLRAPGLGSGGLHAAQGEEHDQPGSPGEDRP